MTRTNQSVKAEKPTRPANNLVSRFVETHMKDGLTQMLKACAVLIAIVTVCYASAQSVGNEGLVRKFFALREQTLDQRGTATQVEQIISLFKLGGIYEHPAASVTMTLDEARSGMNAHLKEGRDARVTINKFHDGPNFAIVETTLRYSIPDASGKLKKVERNGVSIFEFEDGRIVRIAEY